VTHKKSTTPTKNVFSLQTTRFAKSFELLTRSVALTSPEIFPCKATCDPVVLAQKPLNPTGHQSVTRKGKMYIQGKLIINLTKKTMDLENIAYKWFS